MNIFVLDNDIKKAAKYHNDMHLRKMLVEACQLLCSVHHSVGTDADIPYRKTHINHPCSKWARESLSNYNWLCKFAKQLSNEYTYRFDKIHKSNAVVDWCIEHTPELKDIGLTDFAIAINRDKYGDSITNDVVTTYRNYHRKYKQGYVTRGNYVPYSWTRRRKPAFMR